MVVSIVPKLGRVELDAIEDLAISFRYRDGPASEYMINFKNKVWSMSDEDLQKYI